MVVTPAINIRRTFFLDYFPIWIEKKKFPFFIIDTAHFISVFIICQCFELNIWKNFFIWKFLHFKWTTTKQQQNKKSLICPTCFGFDDDDGDDDDCQVCACLCFVVVVVHHIYNTILKQEISQIIIIIINNIFIFFSCVYVFIYIYIDDLTWWRWLQNHITITIDWLIHIHNNWISCIFLFHFIFFFWISSFLLRYV